ncbi:ATP-binding protein [Corynebacterium pseudogenitalium]|uniref:ATP-binding protein n=1 Tax=Corynebacterium pseudogenitalium TaxID=38303 RepID=UPI003B9E2850
MVDSYIARIADAQLEAALRRQGGVLIQGPKGCGKTETASRQAGSILNVETDPSVPLAMATDPRWLLDGEAPRLVDEWQLHPRLWDFARHEIDRRKAKGQFIFTGSTAPGVNATRHSGAGRFARLTMSTMTLFESGESDGSVSLRDVVAGKSPAFATPPLAFADLANRMCRGGLPYNMDLSLEDAIQNVRDYMQTVADVDIHTVGDVTRDSERVRRVLRSIARAVGTELGLQTIATDVEVSRDTARDYLDALSRIFVSVDQPAWSTHLRTKATLRKSPKRHLADPSFAMAVLERGPHHLVQDPRYFGQLFESLVVHELRALTGKTVYHARLNTKLEVDAVVSFDDVDLLVEVKLGYTPEILDHAADTLKRFADQLEQETVLLIVTSGGPVHRRADGVIVAPIGALGP